jgi:hypothetical protein
MGEQCRIRGRTGTRSRGRGTENSFTSWSGTRRGREERGTRDGSRGRERGTRESAKNDRENPTKGFEHKALVGTGDELRLKPAYGRVNLLLRT